MTLKSLFVLVIVSIDILPRVHGAGELDNFVKGMMSNYGDWLRNETPDPSKPLAYRQRITANNAFVQIDCEQSNEYTTGHSKQIELGQIQTDLLRGNIMIELYYFQNVTMKGTYKANGTVVGHPLNGSGNWFISSNQVYQRVKYEGLKVTPEGFFDYSTLWLSFDLALWNITSHFDGLWDDGAGGYVDIVKQTLEEAYTSRVAADDQQHPLAQLIARYIADIIRSTPVSEMIGATLPPTEEPSTFTPSAPPSTSSTTYPPCYWEHSKETILEEIIVGKDVKIDESGEEHVVTKKWMLVAVEELIKSV